MILLSKKTINLLIAMIFNRTKNTLRNTAIAFIEKIVSILLPFAVRTIIIYKLGVEYTGLNSLFTTILSILNLADLGFSSAILHFLYKPVADDDIKTVNALLKYLTKAYRIVAFIIFLGGILLKPAIPFLIKDSGSVDVNIYILYFIFLLNAVSSYLFGAERISILEVYQIGHKKSLVNIFFEFIKTGLQIISLILFSNYYVYCALIPFTSIAINLLCLYVTKKDLPNIYAEGDIDDETRKQIKEKLIFLFLHKVPSLITTTVDSLVISSILGLGILGIYGNYTLIGSSITGFFLTFYSTIKPIVGNHFVKSTEKEKHKLFNSLFFTTICLSIFVCTCLFNLYQPFITFWIGKSYLLGLPIVIILCLFYYAFLLRHFISNIYIDIAGLWKKTILRQYLIAFLNLILDLILVNKYGILGVIAASFFTEFFIGIPLDYYVAYKYVLNKKPFNFITPVLVGLLSLLAISSLCYFGWVFLPFEGIAIVLIDALICIAIFVILFFLLIRKNSNFVYFKDHLLSIVRKKS